MINTKDPKQTICHYIRQWLMPKEKGRNMICIILLCTLIASVYSASVIFPRENKNSSSLPPIPVRSIAGGVVKMEIAEQPPPGLSTIVLQQSLVDCMTSGEWTKQPFSKEQDAEMRKFLQKTRGQYGLPYPLQRGDNQCGSVAFGTGGLSWFRAVCDPDRDSPCCFDGQCQNKTLGQCQCENCYDLRSRLYAEYSTWKNHDNNCQVNYFPSDKACGTLDGATVEFIGDSHMRHMYMGLQILLTGDEELGCMDPAIPTDLKSECRGLYMFTEKVCRERVKSDHQTCSGKVHIRLHELYSSTYAERILKVVQGLIGKPNSVLVIGLGHHDSFNPKTVIQIVAKPVLNMLAVSGQIWPKVIWVGPHSLGILKTPTVPNHLNPSVLNLNGALRPFLEIHKVPFLDTFNLTKGIMSPDGSHYGRGANVLKARVLLDYIHRLGHVSSIADHIMKSNHTS